MVLAGDYTNVIESKKKKFQKTCALERVHILLFLLVCMANLLDLRDSVTIKIQQTCVHLICMLNKNLCRFGAGSEYGRDVREEARRKKFGIISRKYKPEDQPWILKVGGKTGKK